MPRPPFSRKLLSLALAGAAPAVFAQDVPVAPLAAPRPVDAAQTKALQNALKSKNWDAARAAIQGGADVEVADKGGVTPLMRAADARRRWWAKRTRPIAFAKRRQSQRAR